MARSSRSYRLIPTERCECGNPKDFWLKHSHVSPPGLKPFGLRRAKAPFGQKFAANIATATELRKQEFAETGQIQTAYPHHPKPYQTVIWKDQAIQVLTDGRLRLACGGQRAPLVLPLPEEYRSANLRRAELTWRADHYELALTIDTGKSMPPWQEGLLRASI